MSTLPVFVGVDYSVHGVQVCVLDPAGRVLMNRTLPDSAPVLAAAVGRLGVVAGTALEACTGAADLAAELTDHHGWPVHLAHPGYVAKLKQSPDKTDFADARLLADLERVGYLPRVWIASAALRDLRTLVRDRQTLANQRRALKLQVGALLREHRQKCPHTRWTLRWRRWLDSAAALPEQARWVLQQRLRRLTWVEQEVRLVEERLDQATATDTTVAWLRTVKGIGPVTAWTVRAEVGRFDRFRTGKQLARYCGLSPCNRSSGATEADAGLVRAANPELRRVLLEAAWGLMRFDPARRQLAERLKAAGKASCVVAAAVANRFVRWLYHEGVRRQAAA